MNTKPILLGTLAYVLVTFPLAIFWHTVLLKSMYLSFDYFGGEPSYAIGFISILLQGVILSFLYPHVKLKGMPAVRGLKYALLMGGFFWTCHVLAFAAKNSLSNTPLFYLLETFYLCFQFGIYGVLIAVIYGKNQ
ncbi:MAG: hypothetical protein KAJ19_06710 [Gammaproteobacteria bacterium]|nr:hypothetical protein [Gammaproteobacteria bacterium]